MTAESWVRIESDGTSGGTRVSDSEGRPIPMVTSVSLHLSARGFPIADIEVIMPRVDVSALGRVEERCPYCGRLEDSDVRA
jgi:hypothetical protein